MTSRTRFALALAWATLTLTACTRGDAAAIPDGADAAPKVETGGGEVGQVASAVETGEIRLAQARTSGTQTAALSTAARAIPPLGPPVLNAQQREIYTQVFAAVEAGRWEAARTLLARGNHPVANKLFRWLELQLPRSGVAFEDIVQFVDRTRTGRRSTRSRAGPKKRCSTGRPTTRSSSPGSARAIR